jgi:hypothetical protein
MMCAVQNLKILVLGGYGTFGGRLAQLLADEASVTLIIAGRSREKAKAFCNKLPSAATLIPHMFDRDGDLETQLKALSPNVVADASGPFQNYGSDPYRVVKTCLALGINYLDLADGSDFVADIGQFDKTAKERGIFILSGVSSFPVLTAAVVRELAKDMKQLHSIQGGIAPSPYAGVGENVIRAIAGYAGQPVKLTRGGNPAIGFGLTETLRTTIAPPGKLPLHNIRFSLVDVPDLQVILREWPGLDSIWMGAGPVPEILHRALNGLAWLVRLKILPTLLPFTKLFRHAINIIRWGEHRGGMFVAVQGAGTDGQSVTRSWHLLAEGSDGPLIPSMAIEAVIRAMLSGKVPPPGARPATHDVSLNDYEALFKRRTIYTGRREELPTGTPLYKRILQDQWQTLPAAIRDLHDLQNSKSVEGRAQVERGKGIIAEAIAALFGFPQAGTDVPVRVDFALKNGREIWQRTFAGKSFLSIQFEGRGHYENLICERFGPLTFGLAVVLEDKKLHLVARRWDILGLPLPLFLAPRSYAYEAEKAGKFHFHVEISLPLVGFIVRYQGWLV